MCSATTAHQPNLVHVQTLRRSEGCPAFKMYWNCSGRVSITVQNTYSSSGHGPRTKNRSTFPERACGALLVWSPGRNWCRGIAWSTPSHQRQEGQVPVTVLERDQLPGAQRWESQCQVKIESERCLWNLSGTLTQVFCQNLIETKSGYFQKVRFPEWANF